MDESKLSHYSRDVDKENTAEIPMDQLALSELKFDQKGKVSTLLKIEPQVVLFTHKKTGEVHRLILSGTKTDTVSEEETDSTIYLLSLKDKQTGTIQWSELELRHEPDGTLATTEVLRYKSKIKKDPLSGSGIGQAMFVKLQDFIQDIATKTGQSITHRVTRANSQGLSTEKWNSIFIPLLTEGDNPYTAISDSKWIRRYEPAK